MRLNYVCILPVSNINMSMSKTKKNSTSEQLQALITAYNQWLWCIGYSQMCVKKCIWEEFVWDEWMFGINCIRSMLYTLMLMTQHDILWTTIVWLCYSLHVKSPAVHVSAIWCRFHCVLCLCACQLKWIINNIYLYDDNVWWWLFITCWSAMLI